MHETAPSPPASAVTTTSARDVVTRIESVTVYEDRADVQRTADIELPAGSVELVLRGLSHLVSEDHLIARLERAGASEQAPGFVVDDVRIERRIIEDGRDARLARERARVDALRALDAELAQLQERHTHSKARRDAAREALHTIVASLSRRAGLSSSPGPVQATPAALRAQTLRALQHAEAALQRADDDVHSAWEALSRKQLERTRLAQDTPTTRTTTRTTTRRVCDVHLHVSSPGGPCRLVVTTLLPCAAWRPKHEARLVGDVGARSVQWGLQATVWQRTGEAWDGVELRLSTARPSSGAELPTLLEDRLRTRTKTAEERRTVVVQHRDEAIPTSATTGSVPGVDDGGEAREFRAAHAHIPDDGRPHTLDVGSFESRATVDLVTVPERAPQVFVRATLRNAGAQPILAGAVTLVVDGAWVGTGDVLYQGPGETFDLSFGSDDRFVARSSRFHIDDKKTLGKDVRNFVHEVFLESTSAQAERVVVRMRWPLSELGQVKVLHAPHHATHEPKPDEHGLVSIPVDVAAGARKRIALAFSFDTSGDVRIPDPW